MRKINTKLIIAEIGSVHDGSFGNALKLIELAKECGANAVKFQTHIAEFETLSNAPNPGYFNEESRFEYFSRTSFTLKQWKTISERCDEMKMFFISSPFSLEAAELLKNVGVDFIKIASGEVTNIPMLERIAKYNLPTLLSTGMSNWQEIDDAISVLSGDFPLCIMQCSSSYPCLPTNVGLNIIDELESRYNYSVGFSDHTSGVAAAISAAARGATIIEKHLTFSNRMYGSDAKNAMEPSEFKLMSDSIRDVWSMLASPVDKNDVSTYQNMKYVFQKSIVAKCDLLKGTVLDLSHLAFKKPSGGMIPKDYHTLLGKKLKRDLSRDTIILKKDLE